MHFTKMQGLGNDYIFIDCTKHMVEEPQKLARKISDRHFGVGSDGLILICSSKIADFRMEMYNADGSRGKMCGNGIRCFAKYVYERGMTKKTDMAIETDSGIKYVKLYEEREIIQKVRVNMGTPVIEIAQEMLNIGSGSINKYQRDSGITGTIISIGNSHCVVFVEQLNDYELKVMAEEIQKLPCFPDSINVELVRVVDRTHLCMRVWERGSGETLACGTGACAAAVSANIRGFIEEQVEVTLPGGVLEIFWDKSEDTIYMTGPAKSVFEGEYEWKFVG